MWEICHFNSNNEYRAWMCFPSIFLIIFVYKFVITSFVRTIIVRILLSLFLNRIFKNFLCFCVSTYTHTCMQVLMEARRGCWIPWCWRARINYCSWCFSSTLWVQGIELRSSCLVASTFTAWATLPPLLCFKKVIFLIVF